MRAPATVRARVTLLAGVVVAATLVVASVATVWIVERDVRTAAEEAVRSRLEQQAIALGDSDTLAPAAVDGINFGVFRREGELVFGRVFLDDEPIADVEVNLTTRQVNEALDPVTGFDISDPGVLDTLEDASLVLFEVDATADGRFLVGATSPADIEISTSAVQRALLLTVPLVGIVVAALAYWLVGRALRPVQAMADQVSSITSHRLDERVPEPASDDEIARLARTMNGMLRRLEDGDARLRRFSADASHELRSPIASIRAAAELIERRSDQTHTRQLAADVVAEADRMDALVGDLLALAKQEAAGPPDEVTVVEMGALARDVASARRATVAASEPCRVLGDAAGLRRALANLLDNACRHSDRHVRVSVVANGDIVEVRVEDDGPGIPKDKRLAVFERFTRLDDSRSRDAGGAGLGLAMVRSIAEAHGGAVTVEESVDLGGALFVLRLPSAS